MLPFNNNSLNVGFLLLLCNLIMCKYHDRRSNSDSREDRRLRLVTLYDSDRDYSISGEYEDKPRRSNQRSKKTNRLGTSAASLSSSSEAEVLLIDPRKLLTKMAKSGDVQLNRSPDRWSSASRSKAIKEDKGKR